MEENSKTFQDVIAKLSAPMEIRWRVKTFYKEGVDRQNLKVGQLPEGTKGQFLPYIDARDVFHRLDEVAGPGNWTDDFEIIGNNAVKTTITITINGQTKSASDVGYPGREKDGQPLKAAVSDGIKRAAVHFGIGRFLYSTDTVWVEVDKFGRPLKPISTQPTSPTTATPTATPASKSPAKTAKDQQPAPAQISTKQANNIRPGDLPCEIPGCKNTVWASREEKTRHYHKGHIICYFHSKNGDWEANLSEKTKSIDTETGEILERDTTDFSEGELASLMNHDPGAVHSQDVSPDDIPF